jgi:hypothetical protein
MASSHAGEAVNAQQLAARAVEIHCLHRHLDLDELRAYFDELALIVAKLGVIVADTEGRVEQLENHPADCGCTRCTG